MTISTAFNLGEEVYLHTDPELMPRLIVAILVKGQGHIEYQLAQGTVFSWHVEQEITKEGPPEVFVGFRLNC